jgi:hypothetical protein
MIPLIPIFILGLAGTAAYKVSTSKRGIMTNERRKIYEAAMSSNPPLPADQYLTLASGYDNEGLPTYGDALRKRAALLNMSPEKKAARKAAIQKILGSKDSTVARIAANLFETEGAFGSAKTLRDYADALDAAALQSIVAPPAPPPAPEPVDHSDISSTSAPLSTPVSGTVSGGIGLATQASSPESSTPSTPQDSAGLGGSPAHDGTPVPSTPVGTSVPAAVS